MWLFHPETLAPGNTDIRQLPGMHNTHWLHRNECLFSSMQIPWSLDPIWIGVGAVQHRRGCSTRLAWLPSAIQKKKEEKKKKRISSLEKLQVKNESDKNRNKERIAFWCSLYSAGFRGGTKQTLPQTSLTLVTDVEMVISISHHQRWQQWLAVFMQFQMPLVYCQWHLKRQALK